ncbi:MAG: alpha/beta hydrolase [Verrucomicrobiales bacterium]|nr:alpha/beta hydrolase [Verrucomicrobiales bacterium]
MKLIYTLMLAAACSASTALAAPLEPINLWPEGVPGEAKPLAEPESVALKGDYEIEIMSNVSIPQLTMYPAENPNGTAVIVCPGGGYNILAYSHEGTEVCEWLNSIGITAGLLKYRVPRRDQLAKHEAPLQDVQRAIGMMRARADEWKIKSDKIGVLGFSAGGHLSSMALTSDGSRTYKADPKFDSGSCIPNFGVLVYPAYQLDEKNPDKLSPEINVSETTPPAFLVVAHGDKQWAEGSARFYIEMKRADRDCELHIFGKGGHGFGFANTDEEIKQWPTLAAKWMEAMKLVE